MNTQIHPHKPIHNNNPRPLPYLIRRDDDGAVAVLEDQVPLLVIAEANLLQDVGRRRVGRDALLEGVLEEGDAAEFGVLLPYYLGGK